MRARKVAAPADPVAALGEILAQFEPDELADYLAGCAPEDLTVCEHALGRVSNLGWRATPLSMGVQFGALQSMPHTEFLAAKFVEAIDGTNSRQIWNLPARHGKSLIASQWGPAWALDREPTLKIALTSYGDNLANENAIAVRDILVEHADVLSCRLRRDRRRMDRFVTDQGGGVIAAGIGSRLTGFGAHLIVIDDPLKDWKEAHSEARRLAVKNWYRSVPRMRLENRATGEAAAIIVVMTRWHEDDLTGALLAADLADEGEGWDLVRLPAIAEAHDPLGRAEGEALAPELQSIDDLRATARAVGSYLAAGMMQQSPAPEEGTDIMRGWWRWFDQAPPRFDDALVSWDVKMKDKEGGDFVVGQAWGRTGSDFWAVDQLRGQWNFATTKTAVVLMAVRHPEIRRHIVENTGNGPEVMQQLRAPQAGYEVGDDIRSQLGMTDSEVEAVSRVFRRGMTGILPENPKGDKRARMRAYTPLIEAGNVHLPNNAQWAEAFVDEAAMFPNGTHDDMVDACSQALKRLSTSGSSTSAPPARKVAKVKPSARANVVRIGRPGTGRR